ncbi:SusC/RagA family TonB-linked outer membrane protein [Lunatibacter salilacus]|uniref:SusC/RagA family TonB-linked outer membrane protein n=1 Tax=Lunatibacter salilacus TaxID=2483804 RepID=UPI001F366009|nr:TonB-dependent receptor [Lunatibacter salilacus]
MKRKLLYLIKMVSENVLYGLIIQSLLMSTLMAHEISAQIKPIDQTFVRLAKAEGLLFEIFGEIEARTDYRFVYPADILENKPPINIKSRRQSVNDILVEVGTVAKLRFKQVDNTIYVARPGEETDGGKIEIPVEMAEVRGRVTDERGDPIPGATIIIEGTASGTATDIDGNFSLEAPEGAILLVSFIGYQAQRVTLSNQTSLTIILQEDLSSLDEIVVVGYGTQKKSDLTGSISSIKGDAVKEFPVTSIDQALQGRAAGVQVTQASAAPGGGVSVRIRGSNSINSGSEPLYVIDGFPIYPDNSAYGVGGNRQPSNIMSTINPNDIESIEILKDASATSIYGSRGSNGVVLITTKRGKSGESKIDYEGSMSVQNISNRIDVLNGRDYATYLNTMEQSQGGAPLYTQTEIEAIGEGTNWLNEVTRTGMISSHQLSFTGGNEKTQYAVVGNYFENEGIIKNTDFKRYGVRLNLDNKALDDRLTINSSWSINRTESNNAPTDRGGPGGIIITSLGLDPTVPVRNVDGTYALASYDGRFLTNPLQELEHVTDRDINNRILGNTGLTYKILDGLNFKTSIGADILSANRATFFPSENSRLGRDRAGELTKANRSSINILNENILSYSNQINKDHRLDIVAGYTFQKELNEGMSATNRGLSASHVDQATLGGGTDIQIPSSDRREWLLKSFLGRVNYNLMEKYLLTFSLRRDGSSRFGSTNKWANFPSVAGAWRVVEEDFFQGSSLSNLISDLKFRTSWGITGNSEIPVYNSLANLREFNYVFGGNLVLGLAEARLANPGLKWETTTMYNFGIDLSFMENRLNLTTEYFYNQTEDLLLFVTIPSSLGFESILKNSGSLENKGLEISLNYIPINRPDFRWDITGNISFLRNKITDLGTSTPFFSGSTSSGHLGIPGSWVEAGYPIGVWRGYRYIGLFQSQEEIDSSPSRSGDRPGYPRYRDTNGDGTINPQDFTVMGDPNPDFTWGLTTTLNYRKIDFNLFIRGVHGNDIRNLQQSELGDGVQKINQIANILVDSWTPENRNASRPVIDGNRDFANSYRASDYFIEDGSFIRIQNVSIGYTLPVTKFVRNARLYISAQNPLLFTKYKGFDPEVNNLGQNNLNRGDDYDAYPRSKTYTVGINIGL